MNQATELTTTDHLFVFSIVNITKHLYAFIVLK